ADFGDPGGVPPRLSTGFQPVAGVDTVFEEVFGRDRVGVEGAFQHGALGVDFLRRQRLQFQNEGGHDRPVDAEVFAFFVGRREPVVVGLTRFRQWNRRFDFGAGAFVRRGLHAGGRSFARAFVGDAAGVFEFAGDDLRAAGPLDPTLDEGVGVPDV